MQTGSNSIRTWKHATFRLFYFLTVQARWGNKVNRKLKRKPPHSRTQCRGANFKAGGGGGVEGYDKTNKPIRFILNQKKTTHLGYLFHTTSRLWFVYFLYIWLISWYIQVTFSPNLYNLIDKLKWSQCFKRGLSYTIPLVGKGSPTLALLSR